MNNDDGDAVWDAIGMIVASVFLVIGGIIAVCL